MGRAPCCDKANVKRGPWSPEEDSKLKSYIEEHGTGGNWIALPQKIGLKRCGKSCRLRWLNYLRPNIKHGGFSEEEENIICNLYISIGSRWSIIAAQLPGRTDNDIKNYWNTRLKKKLLGKQRKEQQSTHRSANSSSSTLKQEMMMKKGIMSNSINGNFMISSSSSSDDGTQNVYFPEPPATMSTAPYPNQDPNCLNDHTSIRKLLIKLGGRFSDHVHQHHQQPAPNNDVNHLGISSSDHINVSSTQDNEQVYEKYSSMDCWFSNSYSASMNYSITNNNNNPSYELLNSNNLQNNHEYHVDHVVDGTTSSSMEMLQGLNCYPVDIHDQGSSSAELFYGVGGAMGNESSTTGTGTGTGTTTTLSSSGDQSSSTATWVDHMSSFVYPPTVLTNNYVFDEPPPSSCSRHLGS